MKERYVNASEIGTYVFCAKSWQLSQIGAPSQNASEQGEGIEWHAAHSEQVGRAQRSARLARAFAFALLVLLLALAFRFFASWPGCFYSSRCSHFAARFYFGRRSVPGLPAGLLVYDDADRQHLQRPLVSRCLRLAGRPYYLIETGAGLVPVELKSGACPRSGPMPLMWPSL